jgi:hypothetical protein
VYILAALRLQGCCFLDDLHTVGTRRRGKGFGERSHCLCISEHDELHALLKLEGQTCVDLLVRGLGGILFHVDGSLVGLLARDKAENEQNLQRVVLFRVYDRHDRHAGPEYRSAARTHSDL